MIADPTVYVDVICPVFNAQETLSETLSSVLHQTVPQHLCCCCDIHDDHFTDGYGRYDLSNVHIDVAICCFDDGSTDSSLSILENFQRMMLQQEQSSTVGLGARISTQILIGSSTYNGREQQQHDYPPLNETKSVMSRGAPYARNQAVKLRLQSTSSYTSTTTTNYYDKDLYFLCFLDSDDIMHPHRIAEQVSVLLHLPSCERHLTLLGCTFDRIPADSTWHYTQWANSLTDERLLLERFREVTVIQPTWMMTRHRFIYLGGYIEYTSSDLNDISRSSESYKLIHPLHDNIHTLRLAEDLRFFHAHIFTAQSHHDQQQMDSSTATPEKYPAQQGGLLKLVRTKQPLLTYRHRDGLSQSSSTPRKLLLQLRAKAFEDTILRRHKGWLSSSGFVIWGAGRDGKDFFKCLSEDVKPFVRCFVDVDEKKFGYYTCHQERSVRVPVVHFCYLIRDADIRQQFLLNSKNPSAHVPTHKTHVDDTSVGEQHLAETVANEGTPFFGKISKRRVESSDGNQESRQDIFLNTKKCKMDEAKVNKLHSLLSSDMALLDSLINLPVVVCVSMYRTNGALENNVKLIGRKEGYDLWHFC